MIVLIHEDMDKSKMLWFKFSCRNDSRKYVVLLNFSKVLERPIKIISNHTVIMKTAQNVETNATSYVEPLLPYETH